MSAHRQMVLWPQPPQNSFLYFQHKLQLFFKYLVSFHPQTELIRAMGHIGSSGNPYVM